MSGIKPHHRIAIGVSGGGDSIALCILASDWKKKGMVGTEESSGCIDGILGVIIDHGLRPESKEEANRVRLWVSKMGIRCEIRCCDWSDGKPKPGHLQEAARDMRYQIFQDVCIQHQIGVLLIAHHADDQAELFILRLSRNSGILGLAGMAFTSELFPSSLHFCRYSLYDHGILLVRPLLEFSKEDMYKICQASCQEWVEDPTNRNPVYARNRIRMSLGNLSSCTFKSELQAIISLCRKTRSFIDHKCCSLIHQAVTIMAHGYAVIDLMKLDPLNVEDLCLSKFLAIIVQFISQRHRPIRGRTSRLLLNYTRNIPCKISLTAAGCYLCAAPGSKGTKILVCCSPDSPQPSRADLSHKCSCEGHKCLLPNEIQDIIKEAEPYSASLVPDNLDLPFSRLASTESILNEAKELNILSKSTYETILSLQKEESKYFIAKRELKSEHVSRHEVNTASSLCETLKCGQSCYFMSRFLVTWNMSEKVREDRLSSGATDFDCKLDQGFLCKFCVAGRHMVALIRHMVEADWLYLSKVSSGQMHDSQVQPKMDKTDQKAVRKIACSDYVQLSAYRALQALKPIPVPARRALPVLVDRQGLLLCAPSIFFKHCPRLSFDVVFKPRVPLGGGYSSFI